MFNNDILKKIIESGGIPFKQSGKSYIFSCPRCLKPKLYIQKFDGFYTCFKCSTVSNFKGRCEYALSELYGIPVNVLKEQLYGKQEQQLTKFLDLNLKEYFDYEESKEWEYEELPEMVFSPDFIDIHNTLGEKYLKQIRGLTEEHLKTYNILYNPPEQSVVFPVIMNNSLKGWQTRGINRNLKMTSKGLDKTKSLMFYDRLNNSKHCVLTEGPISAIKVNMVGGNVASMGKDVSEYQLELIKNRVNKLYLGLDPDASIVKDRICRNLYGEMEVYLLEPYGSYKDLGEMPEQEVYEQFMHAPKAFGKQYFYFKTTKEMVF